MASGIDYFRLLWNLYRQKRNAGRTKEQIREVAEKETGKTVFVCLEIFSLLLGRHFRRKEFPWKISCGTALYTEVGTTYEKNIDYKDGG